MSRPTSVLIPRTDETGLDEVRCGDIVWVHAMGSWRIGRVSGLGFVNAQVRWTAPTSGITRTKWCRGGPAGSGLAPSPGTASEPGCGRRTMTASSQPGG